MFRLSFLLTLGIEKCREDKSLDFLHMIRNNSVFRCANSYRATYNKIWVHRESKQATMEWRKKGEAAPIKAKTRFSADAHNHFLGFQRCFAYRISLWTLLYQFCIKQNWCLTKKDWIFQYQMSLFCTTFTFIQTCKMFKDLFWMVMEHPLYSSDLSPFDYYVRFPERETWRIQIWHRRCCGNVRVQLAGNISLFFFNNGIPAEKNLL